MSAGRDWRLFLAATTAGALAMAGINTLPLLLGAVVDGLGTTARQAGVLGSVEIGAMAAVSIALAPRMATLSRRSLGLGAGMGLALAGFVSAFATRYGMLLLLRGLTGVCAGGLLAAANAAIAAAPDPDRFYARVSLVAVPAYVLVLSLLPLVIEWRAYAGAYIALAAITACGVPLLAGLPKAPMPASARDPGEANVHTGARPALTYPVLAAGLVLSISQAAIWAFSERIGLHAGLSPKAIGVVLGLTGVGTLAGAGIASWLGTRRGRTIPLNAGIALSAAGCWWIAYATREGAFVAAQLTFALAYAFATPLLLGTGAALDRQGRVVTALGGVMLVGAAAGPAVAGLLIRGTWYAPLAWLSGAMGAIAVALLIPVCRALDRGGPVPYDPN